MSKSRVGRSRQGFTLIEMLIVITVIAILALIVIPRVQGAVIKAREATLKANLHQLRSAIGQFEADTGAYPADLEDLVATDEGDLTTTVPANSYKGPYLTPSGGIDGKGIPMNPFGPTGASATVDSHWDYDDSLGTVKCPAGLGTTTVDGDDYTDL